MAERKIKMESQVFSPFRALGFVSNHIPLCLEARGSDNFVTTVVGSSYHVYNCQRLNLLFVGQSTSEPISALCSARNLTIVATGNKVCIFQRGKQISSYNEHQATVHMLLQLGDHIISIDDSNAIHVWSHKTSESYLIFSLDPGEFKISACMHPSTYLNKILLGSKQGTLQIWNVKTHKLIHELKGWKEPVVVLEQSPAVDVVGVGLQSGRIVLINIKFEKILMSFYQEFGLVTAISFRTDGKSIMATGSSSGTISFWDLEKKQSSYVLQAAHSGNVTGMKFFQKQPLLITSGPDNSLKIWIFDNPDGSCRLLKSRCGHSAPPTQSLFYGSYGNVVLTAGMDRTLRYTAVMRGEQCHEFSQGSLLKKSKHSGMQIEDLQLPPITCIAAETSREKDWDNVVTCHLGYSSGVTWSTMKRAKGKFKLGQDGSKKKVATAVDISSCGNFSIVGYKNGLIEKYNLQSGIQRCCFGKKGNGHKGTIRGVAVDTANLVMVSTSADKSIKTWDFKEHTLIDTINCQCPVIKSRLHRESSLLAVCFEDFSLTIYDIDTRNAVRKFPGHTSIITDISWSSDARWLVSASMDGSIKTWDIPSARLIDCFLVDTPASSVAISPTGEFLATTHQDDLGIYLWSNKVTYSGVYPSPLPNDYQPVSLSLPTTQIETEESQVEVEEVEMEEKSNVEEYISPEQISSPLVTLSMLPESRWQTLINLELIKERNKPKEPPKKPKAAPFFLPTVGGLETKFDITQSNEDDDESSRVKKFQTFGFDSPIQKLLKQEQTDRAVVFLDKLRNMSPSETDVEFRSLGPDAGGSVELLCIVLQCFVELLRIGKDYELIQAYISLFLKLHGDLLYTEKELHDKAELLTTTLQETWTNCDELINQSICLVNYFKSATI